MVQPLVPWALLALVFYIPGVYLEWPSDPWEHLRRINEWRMLDTVGAHSYWYKTAYFIPYSLLSWCIGLRQLFWLDFYYTGICLLLCWQYYRLSRGCGLGYRASMFFVVIQAILFGNNIFSFYRYYGISSTIYAQLGAIALTRIVLDWASWGKTNLNPGDTESTKLSRRCFWHRPTILWLLASGVCLLTLTAFNHPQGIGIAGLGIASIIVWRLIEWKRSALWWLIGGTILINALFLWLYPRPAILETYRAQGWLNAWYGFNILDLTSPAGDRMLQIISVFGLINLAAALVFLPRNHVTAWLTILPLIALSLPVLSLPFAEKLSAIAEHYIVTFHRMLFATPALLAVSHALTRRCTILQSARTTPFSENGTEFHPQMTVGVLAGILLVFCTSVATPNFNRLWHSIECSAQDLKLEHCIADSLSTYIPTTDVQPGWTLAGIAATASGYPTTSTAATRNPELRPTNFVSHSFEAVGLSASSILELHSALPSDKERYLLGSEQKLAAKSTTLLSDWRISSPASWVTQRFSPPVFNYNTPGAGNGSFVIENPKGFCTWVLSSTAYPVSRLDSFSVSMTTRQLEGNSATVFLAVAWYDKSGTFLDSGAAYPLGAGNPFGWHNGIFSYFGASGEYAPTKWTAYSASFGLGYPKAIPVHAHSMRIAALLNANEAHGAIVQLCNIELKKVAPPNLHPIPFQRFPLYSTISLAGVLSGHWAASQTAIDHVGLKELFEVSRLLKSASVSNSLYKTK